MSFLRKLTFSRRLVFVYTLIVACPLMLILSLVTVYVNEKQFDQLVTDTSAAVSADALYIEDCINTVEAIESIIAGNADMIHLFMFSESGNSSTVIQTMRGIVGEIDRLLFVMPKIYSIRIFMDNEKIPERWPVIFSENRLSGHTYERWTLDHVSKIMDNIQTQSPSLCLTRELMLTKRHAGFLQIAVKMEDVFPFLYNTQPPFTSAAVFHGNTLVRESKPLIPSDILSSELFPQTSSSSMPIDKQLKDEGVFIIREKGVRHAAAWKKIPRLSLTAVRVSSHRMNTSAVMLFVATWTALIFAAITGLYILIKFTTSRLMNRLYIIMDGMKQVRNDNLDVEAAVDGTDEVAEMAETFTQMVARIKVLITQIKVEQELVARTEIKAMQNQINAHFLYNVLEMIKMQAELRNQNDIVESITLLGKMMRYCLRWRIHRVTLEEEIMYAQSYISILNIRNDYSVTLKNDIDPQLYLHEVPKMLLQPVVENAFMYAIEPYGKDAVIRLYTENDEEKKVLWLCIADSGAGISADRLSEIRTYLAEQTEHPKPGRIGLKNIQQRLFVFFGPSYTIEIYSQEGSGTLIRIPVPYNLTDRDPIIHEDVHT